MGRLLISLDFGYILPNGTKALGILFSLWTSKLYAPGPTIGLVFAVWLGFYPLKTNAIKFIIIFVICTTEKHE